MAGLSDRALANAMNCTVKDSVKDWKRTCEVFFNGSLALLDSAPGDSLDVVNRQGSLFWATSFRCHDNTFCENLMLSFEPDTLKE